MTTFTKSLTAAALACGIALASTTGASAAGTGALAGLKNAEIQNGVINVHRRHRGRGVALGILGAAAATAIIAGAARADRRRYRHRDSCEHWDYKCSRGHSWACRKFDYHCDY